MKKLIVLIVSVVLISGQIVFAQKSVQDDNSKISEVRLTAKMNCSDCALKIKKQLAFTKGVKYATADYETGIVYVQYRNDKTNVDKIIASLAEIGYEAKIYSPTYTNTRKTCCSDKNSASGCGANTSNSNKTCCSSKLGEDKKE
ncbi:MAG: heavy metal-associated domain-containing protein [Bacteroidales bacterium]|jgi:copper chaperone CopZ